MVGNIAGLEKNSWVSTIEASPFEEAAAYDTFDRHTFHTFGDMKPYAYQDRGLRQDMVSASVVGEVAHRRSRRIAGAA